VSEQSDIMQDRYDDPSQPPAGAEPEELSKTIERQALAARVRAGTGSDGTRAPDAERAAREEHDMVIARLSELREERLDINESIKALVAREQVLTRVVAVFNKAPLDGR
jgi:hypothetical protein